VRTKSAYRTPLLLDTKVVEADPRKAQMLPEEPIQPSETTRIEFTTDNKAEPAIGIVSADEYPQPDEATLTLQKQIADLKKSEELQREYALHVQAQRAAQMAAPAPTLPEGRAERIALWRQHGLSDDDATFLEARPAMIDHPQLTRQAVAAAEQSGLERGSDDFNIAVENNFNTLMGRAEAQATPASTPAFFQPPEPSPRSPAAPDSGHVFRAGIEDSPERQP
jgi:hypothetical protein